MAEIKTGILTAIMHNLETMPRVINVFDDLKPGKKAESLVFSKTRPETRGEALITMIEATVANNRIGTLSDFVPVIYSKVHATGTDRIAQMSTDEIVNITRDIRKADAQVNDSIDWAKKFPDIEVKWLNTGKNKLESEKHKHAGTQKGFMADGEPEFYPELPMEEGKRDGGILSAIHDALAGIPETKNLTCVGISEHGHNLWQEDNVIKYDTSSMEISRWKNIGEIGEVKKSDLEDALNYAASKTDSEKLARKLGRIADQIDMNEVYDTIDVDDLSMELEKIAMLAIEEGYTVEQAYNLIGLIATMSAEHAEEGWKRISNARLSWLKNRTNRIRTNIDPKEEDNSLAATIRPFQQTIRLWAKSWAMAKAENTQIPDEKTEQEAEALIQQEVNLTPEELEILAAL